MYRLGVISACIWAISFLGAVPVANAQSLCETIGGSMDLYEIFRVEYFGGSQDIDGDGMSDHASLRLIEAVACLNPVSDMHNATNTAYAANLAVFDLEASAGSLAPYREVIASLMMVGTEMQIALGGLLTGSYAVVQCIDVNCVPDPIPGFDVADGFEVFAVSTRAAGEPYSGSGDLDLDGTNNLTEYNNVMAQHGFVSDFVVAATSSNLNGSETLRTPGSSNSGSACFIATAAYGTPMAQKIDVLRDFRDAHLLTNSLGMAFVDTYYRMSPPIADVVATHPALRAGVRMALAPVLWLVEMPWLVLGLGGMVLLFRQKRRILLH